MLSSFFFSATLDIRGFFRAAENHFRVSIWAFVFLSKCANESEEEMWRKLKALSRHFYTCKRKKNEIEWNGLFSLPTSGNVRKWIQLLMAPMGDRREQNQQQQKKKERNKKCHLAHSAKKGRTFLACRSTEVFSFSLSLSISLSLSRYAVCPYGMVQSLL